MLRIGICENDPAQLKHITAFVELYLSAETCVCSQFSTGEQLLSAIQRESSPYDLLLLDIDLGTDKQDGISLAQQIQLKRPCRIIFLTNLPQYIEASYQADHTYFILKRNMETWLPRALDKAKDDIEAERGALLRFPRNGKVFLLRQAELCCCERERRVTRLHTERNSVYETPEKLDALLEQLLQPPFLRCHESYIVNLDFVEQYKKSEFLLRDGVKIPISRNRRDEVFAAFHRYLATLI